MKQLLKPLMVSSLLLSSLSALSYEVQEETSTPADSKALVDFRFDFDMSTLEGNSDSFDKSELSVAANTESYTAKDIEKSQAQDLYDFLNQNTSVNVLPSYGSKATQLLDLGGFGQANGFQNIVIKINGRRVNNIDRVPQLLSAISLDSIKSINILKGAGSVLHGDGATGGVIDIKLKKSTQLGYKTYLGSFGAQYIKLSAGYKSDKISLLALSDFYSTDGNRLLSNGDKDAQEIKNSTLLLSFTPRDDIELLLSYDRSDSSVNYSSSLTLDNYNSDPSQAGSSYSQQAYNTQVYGTGLNLQLSKNLELTTKISLEEKESAYVGSSGYTSDKVYTSVPFSAALKFAAKNFELKTGIDGFNGKREETTKSTKKDHIAAFISYNYTHNKKHGFNIGYRAQEIDYTYTPTTGTALNDKHNLEAFEAGYAYKLDKKSSIYFNFNHAFLAPNVDDFFTFAGAFNAFIEPQKVETSTFGYKNITKKHIFKTAIFYSRLNNEIYLNPESYSNTNIDETEKLGFNFYDKYQINSDISTSLNYNYVLANIISEDDNASYSGKKLPGTPEHSITAAITYKFNKISKINISQNYRSETYASNDFTNTATQKQDAYTSTDIAFSYNHSKQLKFFTKVQNLFDQANGIWTQVDAIYPVNFERNIQVGIKGTF